MNHLHSPRSVLSAIALTACCAWASLAGAASHCKGMEENACAADATCTWVQGYTRTDGREVSSHCKLARGKQALNVSEAAAAKPTTR